MPFSKTFAVYCCVVVLICGAAPFASAQSIPEAERPKGPLGSIAVGWTYLYSDQGAGERESLNGWFARPSFSVGRGASVFASFTNYDGTNRKGSLNSHGFTVGVSQAFFRKRRLRPSLFVESGDVRASNAGVIVNQFAFVIGSGITYRINRRMDLVLTPAAWVFLYPKGDPRNVYNAKVGVSFPFGHR